MRRIAADVMRWQDVTQDYDAAVGRRLDLNLAERRCIGALMAGPLPAGAIAAAIGLTPAAVTALVDRLEKRGLVARTRDTEDRRKVLVEPTAAALDIGERYYGSIAREGEALLSTFGEAELEAIARFTAAAVGLQEDELAKLRDAEPDDGQLGS
jgi:DNA-binding MarR family transcriptional regulator